MKSPELKFEQGTLTLSGWQPEALEKVFGKQVWSWDSRSNVWRVPCLMFAR